MHLLILVPEQQQIEKLKFRVPIPINDEIFLHQYFAISAPWVYAKNKLRMRECSGNKLWELIDLSVFLDIVRFGKCLLWE